MKLLKWMVIILISQIRLLYQKKQIVFYTCLCCWRAQGDAYIRYGCVGKQGTVKCYCSLDKSTIPHKWYKIENIVRDDAFIRDFITFWCILVRAKWKWTAIFNQLSNVLPAISHPYWYLEKSLPPQSEISRWIPDIRTIASAFELLWSQSPLLSTASSSSYSTFV